MDIKQYEDKIIESLKNQNLFKHFSLSDVYPTPDPKILDKIFSENNEIGYDEEGIYIIDSVGDKIYCPNLSTSITESGEWLSDFLPAIPVDIDQGGNVRKSDEVEALICTMFIKNLLREEFIDEEVNNICKNYDFTTFSPTNDQGRTFRDYVTDLQSLQSFVINVAISGCRFKIFTQKKDTRRFLLDGIKEEEAARLQNVESEVRAIHYEYSNGILSPMCIKKLSKLERLAKIDERDKKIEKVISNSGVSTIFKLMRLSSEYISPVKKRKIQITVIREVDELLKQNPELTTFIEDRPQIVSRIQKKALSLEKISVRREQLEKYFKNREDFKFPSKM